RLIAFILDGLDLSLEDFFVSNPSLEALSAEYAQFDLGHVQPASVLRRVVELQSSKYSPRHFRSKGLIKRRRLMRIQIIHYYTNAIGIWITLFRKPFHLPSKITARPMLGYVDVSGATLRLTKDKQIPCAVAFVLIVKSLSTTRLRFKKLSNFLNQIFGRFFKKYPLLFFF